MRLHLTIGYDGTGSDANPTCLYCGPSGDAARAAMKTTEYVRFLLVQNPVGVRKANDGYRKPAATVEPEPEKEPEKPRRK